MAVAVAVVAGAGRAAAGAALAADAADVVVEGGGAGGRVVVVVADPEVAGVARAVGVAVTRARDAATDVEPTVVGKARISSRTWSQSTVWPRW